MMTIKSLKAREILNSRGNPTVEVDLETKQGISRASVPSGASRGKNEALELRDGGDRYLGKGVKKAVENINGVISNKLKGKDFNNQKEIDTLLIKLDGTENKSNLGANTILAVSMACCRALAAEEKLPLWKYISDICKAKPKLVLPTPCFLMIEGGLHAGNVLDTQEFMIAPKPGSFSDKVQQGSEIYHNLKRVLRKNYGEFAVNVGLEGGFAAPVGGTKDALDLIMKAAKIAGYKNGVDIILDIAASTFYKDNVYKFEGITFTSGGFLNFYSDILSRYPIAGVEDPFAEEDWKGFQKVTKKFGKKATIIGDDLLTTNVDRIKKATEGKYCNGLILKLNQIGTVSEGVAAAELAQENGWQVFVKHRSGETCDDFIADLSVGLGAGFLMAGAPCRGERTAKYNRLLRIEEKLSQI